MRWLLGKVWRVHVLYMITGASFLLTKGVLMSVALMLEKLSCTGYVVCVTCCMMCSLFDVSCDLLPVNTATQVQRFSCSL